MGLRNVEPHDYVPNDTAAQTRWAKILRLATRDKADGRMVQTPLRLPETLLDEVKGLVDLEEVSRNEFLVRCVKERVLELRRAADDDQIREMLRERQGQLDELFEVGPREGSPD